MTAPRSGGGGPVGPGDSSLRELGALALAADPQQRGTVWFYPTRARPETDDNDTAAVTLVLTGNTGILSVGSSLSVSQSELSEAESVARSMVDAHFPVELKPAPLMVRGARLETVSPSGERVVLATSATSGYPPFQAVFSAHLNPAAAALAASALRGGRGHLFVTYQVEVSLPGVIGKAPPTPAPAPSAMQAPASSTVPLTLEADLATWFPTGPGPHLIVTPGHDDTSPQD